tara:strand:- start:33 stop:638 length:606 start_codon:yes stop_codon:yes gene_type:complete
MINYRFYYWGPLLFGAKMEQLDLDKIKNLCAKDPTQHFSKELAGDIKHEYAIDKKIISEILKPYIEAFREGFKHWYNRPIEELKVKTAWVNYMQPGDYNPLHIHPECDFSSVIYLDIPKELKEELNNYKGTAEGPGSISFTYGENNPYFIDWHTFKPNAGDIYIFPYCLRHIVTPYKSKCERISVSVNFIQKGGSYDKSLG